MMASDPDEFDVFDLDEPRTCEPIIEIKRCPPS